jgi:alginate O-acetyltransferase complex protein AlgJ
MAELAGAGVECVDLLPAFLEARDAPGEPFYMPLDTHWSHRALRIAARVFAERIRAYPWYAEAAREPVRYSTRTCAFKRRGDIVPMLPETERLNYPPMEFEAEQVVSPDGSLYKDERSGPILLLGDSYAAVFHFQDCKHAGLTAHIAEETGLPVDLVLGLGMGPEVRKKLLRRGRGGLDGKRLVIWALSERDLYDYRSPWEKIPLPE